MSKNNEILTDEEIRILQVYESPYKATMDAESLAKGKELASRPATLGEVVRVLEKELKPLQELLSGSVSQGIVLQRLGQDKGLFTEEDVKSTMEVIEKEQKEANKKLLEDIVKNAKKAQDDKAKNNQKKAFNKVTPFPDKK